MLADATAHPAILIENSGRFAVHCRDGGCAVAVGLTRARKHSLECPRQVHRRWSCRADDIRSVPRIGKQRVASLLRVRREDRHESHCSGDADRRRTAHGERADRVRHVVERTQLTLDESRWKQALIDDAHAEAVVSPAHRLNDLHTRKLVTCAD